MALVPAPRSPPAPLRRSALPDDYSEGRAAVLVIVIAMTVTLVAAGLVVVYVAYPHRGERMPAVPWLGDVLGRAAEAAPVIEDDELDLLRSGRVEGTAPTGPDRPALTDRP